MAIELKEVVKFISEIPMAGIHVKNFSTIQNEFDAREFPILAPDVHTPIVFQPVERNSFGDGETARQTIYYLVPYVLACFSQGEGRGLQDILPGIVDAVSTVGTALIKNDTPDTASTLTVDLRIQSALVNTTVNDPIGKGYHGAKIVVLIREFVDGVD